MKYYDRLKGTRDFLRNACPVEPRLGFVLGSGLSFFGDMIEVTKKWKFGDIPGFCPTTVEGHPGQLIIGHLEGVPVAVLQGRLHAYEGHSFGDVVFPIRTLAILGVRILTVTNASGGLNAKRKPGDFMLIRD